MTTHSERPKSNKEETSSLMALTVDGDYVLDSCSERQFYDQGCNKTNEIFLVVFDMSGQNLLLGQPLPVY